MSPPSTRPPLHTRGSASSGGHDRPFSRPAYDQFVPSYAHASYESYNMRDNPRGGGRSPPRVSQSGPRSGDHQFTSDRVHPREAGERAWEGSTSRSRSPSKRAPPAPYVVEGRRRSYGSPMELSPKTSALGREQNASSSTPGLRRQPNLQKLPQATSATHPTPTKPKEPTPANPVNMRSAASPQPQAPSTAVSNEEDMTLADSLAEIFKAFGNVAADSALARHQVAVAEREVKKKSEEYAKSQRHHEKFPATEEHQRKARRFAEEELARIKQQHKEKEESLRVIATSAAAKIPKVLGSATGSVSSEDHLMLRRKNDELEKRCNELQKRLKIQEKLFEDEKQAHQTHLVDKQKLIDSERTARDQLQKDIEKRLYDTIAIERARQDEAVANIRSDIEKRDSVSKETIRNIQQDTASFRSNLSRVPVNLQQQLQSFGDRLKDVPDVSTELAKIRAKTAEDKALFASQTEALEAKMSGLAAGADVERLTNHLTEVVRGEGELEKKWEQWAEETKQEIKQAQAEYARPTDSMLTDLTTLKTEVAKLVLEKSIVPRDAHINREALQSIKELQTKVTKLESLKVLNLEKRLLACEQNSKSFVKVSTHNQAFDNMTNIRKEVDEQKSSLAALTSKVNKEQIEVLDKSPESIAELKRRLSKVESELKLEHDGELHSWLVKEVGLQQEAATEVYVTQLEEIKHKVANLTPGTENGVKDTAEALISNGLRSSRPSEPEPFPVPDADQSTGGPQKGAVTEPSFKEELSAVAAKQSATFNTVQNLQRTIQTIEMNLHTIHSDVHSKHGLMVQVMGLAQAVSNLDARYNNINTLDLHKAMVDQFRQDQFPQLQTIAPLEALVRSTTEKVQNLEKSIKSSETLNKLELETLDNALTKTRSNAHDLTLRINKHETTMMGIEALRRDIESTLAKLESRHKSDSDGSQMTLEIRALRTDVDQNSKDLSSLDDKIKKCDTKVTEMENDLNATKTDFKGAQKDADNLNQAVVELTKNAQEFMTDYSKSKNVVADRLANIIPKVQNLPPQKPMASSSFNSAIRDRISSSTPVSKSKGTDKKRKFENGYSSHSSVSSSVKSNGMAHHSPVGYHRNKKHKGGHGLRKKSSLDSDDEDDTEPLKVPSIDDSEDD